MAENVKRMQTQVLVIGGGATGTGIARDLALRGVSCIVVERRDINAGASGANHGLLHSGARYVSGDMTSAAECRREAERLKQLAPHCIEDTGGLFVAVRGDDEKYIADFPGLCADAGIPVAALEPAAAREMEPNLSMDVIAAFRVNDATIDPFRLSMENMAEAQAAGSVFLRNTAVAAFRKKGPRICETVLRRRFSGEEMVVEADQVISATGAWAGQVAALAGASIQMVYAKGSLLILDTRICQRVINRLRPSSNADILVPGGTVSILGTTSVQVDDLDDIRPTLAEVDAILAEAEAMLPVLAKSRCLRSYSGVRPLVGSGKTGDSRKLSRGFFLLDHAADGLENFITITGGKLTTFRLMAEKAADLVCERLGVTVPCQTRLQPLADTRACQWTEPGLAPKVWLQQKAPRDMLLCECEMVPTEAVDSIVAALEAAGDRADLRAIGLRSRLGKGTCQGVFCGVRALAYLYNRGIYTGDEGLLDLKKFLKGRWKGIRPILWGTPLAQEELQEALHCGFFSLEL
jgi:glycerol-3-phosphate dehydrogenase